MCDTSWRALLVTARSEIRSVAALLRRGGNAGFAELLDEALGRMRGWYGTKEALYQVGAEYCHPRFFGDTCVTGLGWAEWGRTLEELKEACAEAFAALENLPPEERELI